MNYSIFYELLYSDRKILILYSYDIYLRPSRQKTQICYQNLIFYNKCQNKILNEYFFSERMKCKTYWRRDPQTSVKNSATSLR